MRGDHAQSVESWRQVASLDPLSGRGALGLIRSLAAAGDGPGALRHARQHEALVRAELGSSPDPEVTAFVDRLRGNGLEHRATHPELAAAIPDEISRSVDAPTSASATRLLYRRKLLLGGGLAMVLAVVFTLSSPFISRERNARSRLRAFPRVTRMAVLPLQSASNDSNATIVADGLTREIISALTNAGVRVIGYESVSKRATRAAPLRDVAREFGVDAIATGRVGRRGGSMEIALQLVDPQSGQNLWASSTTVDTAAISGVASDAARRLAAWILGPESSSRKGRLAIVPVTSPDAYTSYLLAMRQVWGGTAVAMRRSIDGLEHAIARDSTFALAHAGLGLVLTTAVDYAVLPADEAFRRAEPAIARALALDSNLALAHLAKARILQLRDWNWSGAETEYLKAIEIEPDARAYQTYGWFLEWYVGRAAEGVVMGERAVQLEPSSSLMHLALAWRLRGADQLDRAASEVRTGLALDSSIIDGHWIQAEVYLRRRQFAEAERSAREYIAAGGDVPANSTTLGEILAKTGKVAEAREYAARLELLARRDGPSLVALARTEMALGNRDKALSLLERAVRERVFTIPFQPYWDPIRSDPRFKAVMRAQGL